MHRRHLAPGTLDFHRAEELIGLGRQIALPELPLLGITSVTEGVQPAPADEAHPE